MNYQVLARKWRPQTFNDVVGQEHILTVLANSLSLRRIHHSYLFSGTRGVGKTSIARLLAKGLNCKTGITATPCGVCDNCYEVEKGHFLDLIELDAASRTKIEDTRDLLDNVQYAPARGRFKVYLIDEVHMLSRHSLNALLKTLEEPPAHVKFLLATTDPQKLPMTIISRCLQLHLKALDTEQISARLKHILDSENIVHEPRALQLLARAADGSLRDALSLTDQAIASGNGKLMSKTVSTMLGIIGEDQALALIEAMVNADSKRVLSLINIVAALGIDWEALLVEMLSLLHCLAMLQLSPSAISVDMLNIEQRLRKLACTIPPTEVQLYYQILLIGRKELPFAPNRRIGVEIALLRALALQPSTPLPEPQGMQQACSPVASSLQRQEIVLSDNTNAVLSARKQLYETKGENKEKNKSITPGKVRSLDDIRFKGMSSVTERIQSPSAQSTSKKISSKKKDSCSCTVTSSTKKMKLEVTNLKGMKKFMEHKKHSGIAVKLFEEAIVRDPWTAKVVQLELPRIAEQVALNTWKEQKGNRIFLHFRPGTMGLNFSNAKKVLEEALATLYGNPIELTFIEDNNPKMRTPLEWCQSIYEEKLAQARKVIMTNKNIQTICKIFDADLDEKNISPFNYEPYLQK